MSTTTVGKMKPPSDEPSRSNTGSATSFQHNLPRELWTQILSYIPPHQLWHTCRLVSRDFCNDSEFVIRTVHVGRRMYMLRESKIFLTFSHFGKANDAYFKPSSLPKDPTLRCEVNGRMYATYTFPLQSNAMALLPWYHYVPLLVHAEPRDMSQPCATCKRKYCPRPYDICVYVWLEPDVWTEDGFMRVDWRQLFARYLRCRTRSENAERRKRKRNALLNRARVKFGMNFKRSDDPVRWDEQARKVGWLHSRADDMVAYQ